MISLFIIYQETLETDDTFKVRSKMDYKVNTYD